MGLGWLIWAGMICGVAAMIWLTALFLRAPRGWEDHRGWHPERRNWKERLTRGQMRHRTAGIGQSFTSAADRANGQPSEQDAAYTAEPGRA